MGVLKIQRSWLNHVGRRIFHDMMVLNDRLAEVEFNVAEKSLKVRPMEPTPRETGWLAALRSLRVSCRVSQPGKALQGLPS